MITHERANLEEWSPYMGVMCAPHVPLAIYGRAARADPACDPRECVWHAWESQILPLCQDDQFPEDTVFVVCEEDFRFFEKDEAKEQELEERARQETAENLLATGFVDDGLAAEARALGARPKAQPRAARKRGDYTDFEYQQVFVELVSLLNQCAANDCGDLVWAGWMPAHQATGEMRQTPTWGTHMVCLTAKGARWLTKKIQETRASRQWHYVPGHWDLWLKRWLHAEARKEPDEDSLQYSWLYPSVGSFRVHQSGCQPTLGQRFSEWQHDHVADLASEVPRRAGQYEPPTMRPRWVAQLAVMHPHAGLWKTRRPYPLPSGSFVPFPRRGLRVELRPLGGSLPFARRQVEEGEYWRGGEPDASKLNAKKRRRDSPNRPCPVDARHRIWATGLTKRAKRVRRKALLGYMRYRHFVETEAL